MSVSLMRLLLMVLGCAFCASLSAQPPVTQLPLAKPANVLFFTLTEPAKKAPHRRQYIQLLKLFVAEVNARKDVDLAIIVSTENPQAGFVHRPLKKLLAGLQVPHAVVTQLPGKPARIRLVARNSSWQLKQGVLIHPDHSLLFWDVQHWQQVQKPAGELLWLKNRLQTHQPKLIITNNNLMPVGLLGRDASAYSREHWQNLLNLLVEKQVTHVLNSALQANLKASITTSGSHAGLQWVNAPSAAYPVPFDEAFAVYEMDAKDPLNQLGFYLEVRLTHEGTELTGRKLSRVHKVSYPKTFDALSQDELKWYFRHEPKVERTPLTDTQWTFDTANWLKSGRHQAAQKPYFANRFSGQSNTINILKPEGHWQSLEVIESLKQMHAEAGNRSRITYDLNTPVFKAGQAGGFIRLFIRPAEQTVTHGLVLYWGKTELPLGELLSHWLPGDDWQGHEGQWQAGSNQARLIIKKLPFYQSYESQTVSINVGGLLAALKLTEQPEPLQVDLSHGVWSTVRPDNNSHSRLVIKQVSHRASDPSDAVLTLNGRSITVEPTQ
jgi:hypothetical protein